MWDKLCDVLTDFEYLQAKISLDLLQAGGVIIDRVRGRVIHRLFRQQFDVSYLKHDFGRALTAMPANHPMREQIAALYQAIDENSHVLGIDPSLLIQQMHNALVWDWDETTKLGRRVRDAARRCARKCWLKQVNPRLPDPALPRIMMTHNARLSSVAFSPNGKMLASASPDGTVILWDAETGESKQAFFWRNAAVQAVAFTADGKMVAIGSSDGMVLLWDTQTGKSKQRLTGRIHEVLSALAFSPDGKALATASVVMTGGKPVASELRFWSADSLQSPYPGLLQLNPKAGMGDLEWEVTIDDHALCIAFAPQPHDNTLVVGCAGTLRLLDAQSGQLKQTVTGYGGFVLSFAFSADANALAIGYDDGIVGLWDTRTGKLLACLPCVDNVLALWFSPDSRELRAADAGGAAHVPNVYVLEIVKRET